MKLTAKLAHSQIKINKSRSVWTLAGIMLATAMITAVYGLGASGYAAIMRIMGEDYQFRSEYLSTIISIAVILSVIIVSASVIVVSNSFRVSAGERTGQFGILKSVGATKKQIAAIIMNESILLSSIGIPAGIILGLLLHLSAIEIANFLLNDINQYNAGNELIFPFVVVWQAILLAVIVSFITVVLSAWLPARKAAKIAAIDAIRGAGEIKINKKQVKANWLISKLFKFEGTLASKSMKRSKRNFRATVMSLTISILLFIGASSFGGNLNRMANLVLYTIDANVMISVIYNNQSISQETFEDVTLKLREFPESAVFGTGSSTDWNHLVAIPVAEDMLTQNMRDYLETENRPGSEYYLSFGLVTVDDKNYAELCKLAGVPLGSNILLNYCRTRIGEKWTEFTPFNFSGQAIQVPHFTSDSESDYEWRDLPLHGELRGDSVPNEIYVGGANLTVVVPFLDKLSYDWFIQSPNPYSFEEYAYTVLDEFFPSDDTLPVQRYIHNVAAAQNAERSLVLLVMTFVYGFVGMLTLIGLTNVISTISTNIRSRSREFAVLKSVGMTHSGLNRMLNLESILSSVKSLIYGLPLGVGASYLIYKGIMNSVFYAYEFPWAAVLQSILAVFIITWVTMRYSASRLHGANIIESIRSGRL